MYHVNSLKLFAFADQSFLLSENRPTFANAIDATYGSDASSAVDGDE